jgi:hypothetical protein
VRPPPKPPFDALDAVALPFRVAIFPLRVLGLANARLVGFAVRFARPQEYGVLERLADAGLRPRFGSFGRRSGIAAGLRVDRWSPFFVETAYSIRQSQRHQVGLDFDRPRYRLLGSYTFQRNTEPHFWGIGPGTRDEDRADYLWDQQLASLTGITRAKPWTLVGGLAYQDNRIGRGFDDERTDLQDTPGSDLLFGVNERTKYFVYSLGATFDKTDHPGFQRRGYVLELAASVFRGRDGTDSDFHRIRGAVTGFIPANPRQALAVRGIAEINRGDGGRGVPFTHLASLGHEIGGRAYSHGRFRDLTMAAIMAEWRYEVWRELHERGRVESFLLLDSGAVEDRLLDIDFDDLRWSYGFGMRVVWNRQVRWLIYLAFGDDGARLNVNFSSVY